MTDSQSQNQGQAQQGQFAIQRVYLKDLSFETPNSPSIFQEKEWKPELTLDINTDSAVIGKDIYEVILTLTVTVKSVDKVAFIAEVKQAGIFAIAAFEQNQLEHALGSFCPSILYPYARTVITNIVSDGSFPQLVLAPINFDALYAEHLKKKGGDVEVLTEKKSDKSSEKKKAEH